MKAIQITELHQPVEWKEIEQPQPEQGEVLIKIEAAALNHRDLYIQKGLYPNIQAPCTLGSDGVGVVEAVGEGVKKDWIGKEVIINPGIAWGDDEKHQSKSFRVLGMPDPGTFAEYFKIGEEYIHEKPSHLDKNHAAALPLAGLTAYRALFVRAELEHNEKVLITGIGGGVAQMAMLFALEFGAEVHVTSGSDEKIRKAIELGAKGAANYKNDRWAEALKDRAGGFDVIIDSAGGDGFPELTKIANPGGRIAFYGGTLGKINNLSPQIIFWKQLSLVGSTMGSPKNFNDMVGFVKDHQIKPVVDRTFPMSETQEAMDFLEEGQQFGKVVLVNKP